MKSPKCYVGGLHLLRLVIFIRLLHGLMHGHYIDHESTILFTDGLRMNVIGVPIVSYFKTPLEDLLHLLVVIRVIGIDTLQDLIERTSRSYLVRSIAK